MGPSEEFAQSLKRLPKAATLKTMATAIIYRQLSRILDRKNKAIIPTTGLISQSDMILTGSILDSAVVHQNNIAELTKFLNEAGVRYSVINSVDPSERILTFETKNAALVEQGFAEMAKRIEAVSALAESQIAKQIVDAVKDEELSEREQNLAMTNEGEIDLRLLPKESIPKIVGGELVIEGSESEQEAIAETTNTDISPEETKIEPSREVDKSIEIEEVIQVENNVPEERVNKRTRKLSDFIEEAKRSAAEKNAMRKDRRQERRNTRDRVL